MGEIQNINFVKFPEEGPRLVTVEVRTEIADCGGCGVYMDHENGEVTAVYCDRHEPTDDDVY